VIRDKKSCPGTEGVRKTAWRWGRTGDAGCSATGLDTKLGLKGYGRYEAYQQYGHAKPELNAAEREKSPEKKKTREKGQGGERLGELPCPENRHELNNKND